MATQWSDTTTHAKSEINNGNKYEIGDMLTLEALNSTVENSLNAIRMAQNAQSATSNGVSYDFQNPSQKEQATARKNIGLLNVNTVRTNCVNSKKIQMVSVPFLNPVGMSAVISGENVWSDGINTYYSDGSTHYKLVNIQWQSITHSGSVGEFEGVDIWSDGTNIYLSIGSSHFVLDNNFSWAEKTWTGLTNFRGRYIWSDGADIYYDNMDDHYKLNKATNTWESNTWNGYTNISGDNVWSDGINIFYSTYTTKSINYIFDKKSSSWYSMSSKVVGQGVFSPAIYGVNVLTFNGSIYNADGTHLYVLSKVEVSDVNNTATCYWIELGSPKFLGMQVWSDGYNYYYSSNRGNYLLLPQKNIR